MAIYGISIKGDNFGGTEKMEIQTGGSTWMLTSEGALSLRGSTIRLLTIASQKLVIDRDGNDGNHWELTCAIECPQKTVTIRSEKLGSQIGSGTLTVSSGVDTFVHFEPGAVIKPLKLA